MAQLIQYPYLITLRFEFGSTLFITGKQVAMEKNGLLEEIRSVLGDNSEDDGAQQDSNNKNRLTGRQ